MLAAPFQTSAATVRQSLQLGLHTPLNEARLTVEKKTMNLKTTSEILTLANLKIAGRKILNRITLYDSSQQTAETTMGWRGFITTGLMDTWSWFKLS